MKKNLLFTLCCIVLFAISCDGKSLIFFGNIEHDFGKVHKDAVVKHAFNFQNKGSSTLIIERINAG
jgi:hypothetical protein